MKSSVVENSMKRNLGKCNLTENCSGELHGYYVCIKDGFVEYAICCTECGAGINSHLVD